MMNFFIFNNSIENTENSDHKNRILMIRNALSNELKIDRIIKDIIHIKGDFCVKLRFCQAVSKYENESEPLEKKNKSTKIVSIFIKGDKGEMFKIKSLTKERVKMILRNNKNLILAKEDIIREIEQHEDIVEIIKKYSS